MKRIIVFFIILSALAGFSFYLSKCFGQVGPGVQRRVSPRSSSRKIVQLAEPKLTGPISLEESLARRRSVRQFTNQQLKSSQISQLAWAGQGITDQQKALRTAPSAGSVYPIELYFATQEGLFVYGPQQHILEQILEQDVRSDLATAASMQEAIVGAPCDIIIAGSARKLSEQFRTDARKYLLLEAGHVAQNILLQAVCLDLGADSIGSFDARSVSRICRLGRDVEPIYIICVGYPAAQQVAETGSTVAVKRAALITASQDFRDEELFETKRVLDAAGVQTVIASTRTGPIRGILGNVAQATILVNQLRVDDFDAIVFIGGTGAVFEYFTNPAAVSIVRQAVAKRKILGAISVTPSLLANAGVLTGVRATGFLSERDRLVQAGAIYTGVAVEMDRWIITARDPQAAALFGQAIAETLASR